MYLSPFADTVAICFTSSFVEILLAFSRRKEVNNSDLDFNKSDISDDDKIPVCNACEDLLYNSLAKTQAVVLPSPAVSAVFSEACFNKATPKPSI